MESMSSVRVLVLLVALLGMNGRALPATGFVNLPFSVEGADRTAALFVPPDYSESREWPLIIYLHGGGGKGDNAGNAVNEWMDRQQIVGAIRANPERFRALVVIPRCPEGRIWAPIPPDPLQSPWRLERHGREPVPDAANHVTAAIDAVIAAYAVDQDRITLTGHSMGGEGSTRYAALHANRIAAVAPSAGFRRYCARGRAGSGANRRLDIPGRDRSDQHRNPGEADGCGNSPGGWGRAIYRVRRRGTRDGQPQLR